MRTRVLSISGGSELKVDCEPGETAVGGGVSLSNGSAGGTTKMTQSAPANAESAQVSVAGERPTAWASGFDGSGMPQSVTFYAVCASP